MINFAKYVRPYTNLKRIEKLIHQGKCPVCEGLLTELSHRDCLTPEEKQELLSYAHLT